MAVHRRFPVLDPTLPVAPMPPGRPRGRARDLFTQVRDELLRPAQDHARTVVTRAAGGPRPGTRGHTTADTAAGARRDADRSLAPAPFTRAVAGHIDD